MEFSVRQVDGAHPGWGKDLLSLQKQCLPADTAYPTKTGWWFVAISHNGTSAGFAGMVMSSRWIDCAYLCRAGVLPEFRGQGLQKRFIRARLKKARALGLRWVITDTLDNPPSANSLISCGFKMFTPSDPWGINRTLYWRYRIDDAV